MKITNNNIDKKLEARSDGKAAKELLQLAPITKFKPMCSLSFKNCLLLFGFALSQIVFVSFILIQFFLLMLFSF